MNSIQMICVQNIFTMQTFTIPSYCQKGNTAFHSRQIRDGMAGITALPMGAVI